MKEKSDRIAVIGSDPRLRYAALAAKADGYDTFFWDGKDGPGAVLADATVVLLPLPVSRDGVTVTGSSVTLDDLKNTISAHALVFGGNIKTAPWEAQTVDYNTFASFALANAVPSAEGAVQRAMELTPFTLAGSSCLVVGAGKIGSVLADRLRGLRARVTVSARRDDDLARLASLGFSTVHTARLADTGTVYDVVFNTVPAPVVTAAFLRTQSPETLVLDLASAPGGTDFEAAQALHIRAVTEPGLPARVAPKTAGEAIWQTIKTYKERNV